MATTAPLTTSLVVNMTGVANAIPEAPTSKAADRRLVTDGATLGFLTRIIWVLPCADGYLMTRCLSNPKTNGAMPSALVALFWTITFIVDAGA
jgi:hypothetical protein